MVWASVFVKLDWSLQTHLVLLLSVQRGGVAYYCRGLTNCHVTHLPILLGWSVQLNKFATLHIIFAAKIMHRIKMIQKFLYLASRLASFNDKLSCSLVHSNARALLPAQIIVWLCVFIVASRLFQLLMNNLILAFLT